MRRIKVTIEILDHNGTLIRTFTGTAEDDKRQSAVRGRLDAALSADLPALNRLLAGKTLEPVQARAAK